jgi:hypothetical protein
MVALINVGSVGTPAAGHDDEPANIAFNIFYVGGASPLTEVGVVNGVRLGRDGIAPNSEVGSYPQPLSGNAVTFTGLNDAIADVVDSFSVTYHAFSGAVTTLTLDAAAFTGVATLDQLKTVIDALEGGLQAKIDSQGNLQVTSPFLTAIDSISLKTSVGLAETHTTVDITGVTDAEAGAADSFTLTFDGTPLDTSGIDFAAISSRAELAAALDALPHISVTESTANGGTLVITAETHGPRFFTNISLADLTPNPATAHFGMQSGEALNGLVAAAEAFALSLNGTPLDFSNLDFGPIETATELAAALDALDGISAALSDAFITISSDLTGPDNAFSGLQLIDNQGSPAAPAIVHIDNIDGVAHTARGFTLSLDGVAVDTSVVDFSAVTDGESLAAELDKIDGIHVVYQIWNAGRLEITSDTVGPAVFSDVTLTHPLSVTGFEFSDDVLTGFAAGTLILGLSGNDHLTGQDADDRLEGGAGNDTLIGAGGPDELIGGDGDDTLFGNAGDTLDGGNDDDLIVIDALPAGIAGGAGEDTLRLMIGMAVPQVADIERIEVGADGITADFSAWNGPARVWITAGGGASVTGSAFDDTVTTGAGDDGFDGGDGIDTLVLTGTRAQYRVGQLINGDIRLLDLRVGLPDGMDSVRQVERFVFADATFDAATVLNDPPTGGVTLGGATEDQTLVADTSALADQDGLGALHFQWQRDAGAGFVDVGTDQASYTPGDADVGAILRVIVSYTDLNGAHEQVSATAGPVANLNDAPVIGGGDADVTIPENTLVVASLTASDIDGPALAWSIAGGADASLFHIDAGGVLSFVAAPDFEHPADHDHDNGYLVTVRAFDGSAFDDQDFTIVVTDVSEAPPVTVLPGTPGDDDFAAPSGNGEIDAGAGRDSVTFDFAFADATISFTDDGVIVDHGTTHTVLTGVERFVFTDGTIDRDDGNPLVDDLFYYARYRDVWAAHVDADDHYAAFGAAEGRAPSESGASFLSAPSAAGFDAVYYLRHNPDVAAAGVDPLQHFLTFGWREGRDPNALFDTAGYLAAYQDVATAGVNPLDHYNTFGWREGRDPSVGFDTTEYLAHYADVAAAGVNPLTHYLQFGVHEGRSAFADGVWG